MEKFAYSDHPHVANRTEPKPTHGHPKAKLGFNSRLGLFITKSVGTMWAAYLFFGLTLVSLPSVLSSGSVLVLVSWIAQTFLQLVLLPIIIVGQNIQAAASDARAKATYDDATAILHQSREIQKHLLTQDEVLDKMIRDLARVEKKVQGK